eukprot:8968437-Pyramimonas_sp.AAC.1
MEGVGEVDEATASRTHTARTSEGGAPQLARRMPCPGRAPTVLGHVTTGASCDFFGCPLVVLALLSCTPPLGNGAGCSRRCSPRAHRTSFAEEGASGIL